MEQDLRSRCVSISGVAYEFSIAGYLDRDIRPVDEVQVGIGEESWAGTGTERYWTNCLRVGGNAEIDEEEDWFGQLGPIRRGDTGQEATSTHEWGC